MALALHPPFPPMEALSVDEVPTGPEWQYEPKWDGFRCLVFRDGDKVELQSKAGQPLTRYFPELVAAFQRLPGPAFVLDGEIVVPVGEAYDFDALLQRIHPAASRVKKLSVETPARYIAFDLLASEDGRPLLAEPLHERRKRLEAFARRQFKRNRTIDVSPTTEDAAEAERWLKHGGGRL